MKTHNAYVYLFLVSLLLVAFFTHYLAVKSQYGITLTLKAYAQNDESPWPSTPGFPSTQGPSQNGKSPWQSTPGFPSIEGPPRDSQTADPLKGQSDLPSLSGQTKDVEDSWGQPSEGGCNELEIKNITASGFESDPADYHPPTDAIDGESSTWWSNNGKDPWLQIDLGESYSICTLSIEWNKGDKRDYIFEVQVSDDGNSYKKVYEGNNDKGSTDMESYEFDNQANGQYIKLTITDTSSKDGWTSIQEINAIGTSNHKVLD